MASSRRSRSSWRSGAMDSAISHDGVPVRLTDERWAHIVRRHPEMGPLRAEAVETIERPDLVQAGEAGTLLAIRWLATTPLTAKFCVVVYRETSRDDGFVLTAYLTRRPSTTRSVLWKR